MAAAGKGVSLGTTFMEQVRTRAGFVVPHACTFVDRPTWWMRGAVPPHRGIHMLLLHSCACGLGLIKTDTATAVGFAGRFFRVCTLTPAAPARRTTKAAKVTTRMAFGTVRHIPNANIGCCTLKEVNDVDLQQCVQWCAYVPGCVAVVHSSAQNMCTMKCGTMGGVVAATESSVTFMHMIGSHVMQCSKTGNSGKQMDANAYNESSLGLTSTELDDDQTILPYVPSFRSSSESLGNAELAEADDDGVAGADKEAFADVVVFSTTAQGSSKEVIAHNHGLNKAYCETWGCTWHVHEDENLQILGVGRHTFERYRGLQRMLRSTQFLKYNTFIYIDPLTAIARTNVNLLKCLPFESGFDVLFGNPRTAANRKEYEPRDNLDTSMFAVKRSEAANRFLDHVIGRDGSGDGAYPVCANIMGTGDAVGGKHDVSCIVSALPQMQRFGILSSSSPIQVFTRIEYVRAAQASAPVPPLISCASGSCVQEQPVISHCADDLSQSKECVVQDLIATIVAAQRTETRETCKTYLLTSGDCFSAESEIETRLNLQKNSYAIVISTFARDEALLAVLPHWLSCPNVSSVNIVWHNPGREPVARLKKLGTRYPRLHILQQQVDRLSNR